MAGLGCLRNNTTEKTATQEFQRVLKDNLHDLCNKTIVNGPLIIKLRDAKLLTSFTAEDLENTSNSYNRASDLYNHMERVITEEKLPLFLSCLQETENDHIVTGYFKVVKHNLKSAPKEESKN